MEKNLNVIITGAANGIGKALALGYSETHANLILIDKDKENGNILAEELKSKDKKASFFYCDISKAEEITDLFHILKQEYKEFSILINNAGFGIWKSPFELSIEEWDSVINTNLRAAFLLARESAKLMRPGASIINISSTRAFMSEENSEAYAASKGGLLSLTHALAASLSHKQIRVNCISPGWIETKNYKDLKDSEHKQHFAGRVGYPDDIVSACLYLSSKEAGFITGTNLIIDGGMTKKMIYE